MTKPQSKQVIKSNSLHQWQTRTRRSESEPPRSGASKAFFTLPLHRSYARDKPLQEGVKVYQEVLQGQQKPSFCVQHIYSLPYANIPLLHALSSFESLAYYVILFRHLIQSHSQPMSDYISTYRCRRNGAIRSRNRQGLARLILYAFAPMNGPPFAFLDAAH